MKVLKIILFIALIPLLYVILTLAYGTFTDYKPAEKTDVLPSSATNKTIEKDTLTFYIWNVGYAGLGVESDFFMDGGSMTRASKKITKKNLDGIKETIKSWNDADFILLQEVDEEAKRSYGVNQFEEIDKVLGNSWAGTLAYNYRANYIPVPLLKPYGKVIAGLATYSPYLSQENTRYQFPGNFGWPKRIFFLDRCFLVQRYALNGKDLVVINTHNSAYDDGSLKTKQMDFLKKYISEEYAKGNYVIIGGDWNQCPPNYNCYDGLTQEQIKEIGYEQNNVPQDFMPEDWNWAYDTSVKTNRKLETAYTKGKTFTTIIDFYLTSPNIQITKVKGIDLDFKYSDHQPVKLEVYLKTDSLKI